MVEALTAYLDGVQERLHKAELAEAEARARAVEEAKRRRLTLALASTVLLAMTLGGGGWLWVKSERDARKIALGREVNQALNKATALLYRSKAASRAVPPCWPSLGSRRSGALPWSRIFRSIRHSRPRCANCKPNLTRRRTTAG